MSLWPAIAIIASLAALVAVVVLGLFIFMFRHFPDGGGIGEDVGEPAVRGTHSRGDGSGA